MLAFKLERNHVAVIKFPGAAHGFVAVVRLRQNLKVGFNVSLGYQNFLGSDMSWPVVLGALSVVAGSVRFAGSKLSNRTASQTEKAAATDAGTARLLNSLKLRYLAVMLVVRFADWLQGPYFYELYAKKIDSRTGATFTPGAVSSLFLVGFCSSAIFGTAAGSLTDSFGRYVAF